MVAYNGLLGLNFPFAYCDNVFDGVRLRVSLAALMPRVSFIVYGDTVPSGLSV